MADYTADNAADYMADKIKNNMVEYYTVDNETDYIARYNNKVDNTYIIR